MTRFKTAVRPDQTMQEPLQQLASSLQSNLALRASALVGRKVLVYGSRFYWAATGSITFAVDIPKELSQAVVRVYNGEGEVMHTLNVEQPKTGLFHISWDGMLHNKKRLESGAYRIIASGTLNHQDIALKTLTLNNVDSVSLGNNGEGLKLNLAGIGAVGLEKVRQIKDVGSDDTSDS